MNTSEMWKVVWHDHNIEENYLEGDARRISSVIALDEHKANNIAENLRDDCEVIPPNSVKEI